MYHLYFETLFGLNKLRFNFYDIYFCLGKKRFISTFDKFWSDCDLKFIAIKKRCGSSEQTAPIINEDFFVSQRQRLALGRSSFFCQLVDAR